MRHGLIFIDDVQIAPQNENENENNNRLLEDRPEGLFKGKFYTDFYLLFFYFFRLFSKKLIYYGLRTQKATDENSFLLFVCNEQ